MAHKQTQLALTTLGSVTVVHDNQPCQDLGTRKTVAMLVYLACSKQPTRRETLTALFWEDVPETNARASLSVALSQLRKQLPGYIIASRDTVSLNSDLPLSLDAEIFARGWHNWRRQYAGPERTGKAALALLEKTLSLYQGPFLNGLSINGGAAFEEWVRFERERLERIVLRALEELATGYLNRGEYQRGVQHARRLLQLDPYRESSHHLLMLLLAAQGQRSAALAHFESCRRLLEEELGVVPGLEIRSLVERLAAPVPHYPLPARPSFMAGRGTDLGQIRHRLLGSECRLLVIIGSGGVGKSHLALEAAWSLRDHFLSGVCFVPLATHRSTADLATAVAAALGLEWHDAESAHEQLRYHLRQKELLLVLDGFERALPAAALLSELLAQAPHLRIMVTSRERLGLPQEWLYALDGLSYPQRLPGPQVSLEQLATEYGALDLFRQEARRLAADIAEEPRELAAVVRICQLLDGLPFGIQLAANWLRLLTAREIADELVHRFDFLAGPPGGDRLQREKNLSVLLSHALDGLTARERHAYLRLSVFSGSFARAAAEYVTEANLSVLRSLIDKSLLRQSSDRLVNGEAPLRFVLPRLLQQYAREKLRKRSGEDAVALQRHGAYYLAYLRQRQLALCGGHVRELQEIEAESANICAAWERAVADGQQEWLAQAVNGLGEYYRQRGHYHEGEECFARAAGQVRQLPHSAVLRARLLAWQAVFTAIRGHADSSRQLLEQSRMLLARNGEDNQAAKAFVYLHLSRLVARRDLKEAERLCGQALLLYQRARDGRGIGLVLAERARVRDRKGRQGDALRDYASGLHYLEAAGDIRGSADLLSAWANAATVQGQLAQAEDLARQAHRLYQHLNSQASQGNVLQQLGQLLIWQGKWEEAVVLLDKSLLLYEQLGYQRRLPRAHGRLALALANRGDYEVAGRHLESAYALAVEMEDEASKGQALWLMGWIGLATGRYRDAQERLYESVELYWHLGERVELSHSLAALACSEVLLGNLEAGENWLIPALELAADVRYPYSALVAINTMAMLLATREVPERAVELFTMASDYTAVARSTLVRDCFQPFLTSASAALSPAGREAARAHGATLELWETVDMVLDVLATPSGQVEAEMPTMEAVAVA